MNILKKTVAISLFSILSSASYAKNAYVDQFTKLLESNVTQLNIRSPDAEKMK